MSEAPDTSTTVESTAPASPTPDAPAPAPAASAESAPSEGAVATQPPEAAVSDEPVIETAPTEAAGDSEPIDPESYTFTLPEAFTADATVEKAARETFASAGVPKEAAQPLVDLFT